MRLARLEQDRRRRELDDSAAEIAGQPVVGEDDRVPACTAAEMRQRPPGVAADLEEIGEVHLEQQGEANVMRARVEIAHREALVGTTRPDELRPDDVDRVLRQIEPAGGIEEVGVGQIGGQERVVVRHDRAEQQRPAVIDQQLHAGEEAHVLVVKALGAAFPGHDVAVMIEQAKRVAVLQGARPALLQRRGRRDVELHDRGTQWGTGRRRLVGRTHEHPRLDSGQATPSGRARRRSPFMGVRRP